MANEDLLVPVTFQASRLDATVMPAGFSQAFSLYLLQQSQSNDSVAAKANQAAEGAYQAQVKNDKQDEDIEKIENDKADKDDPRFDTINNKTGGNVLSDIIAYAQGKVGSGGAGTLFYAAMFISRIKGIFNSQGNEYDTRQWSELNVGSNFYHVLSVRGDYGVGDTRYTWDQVGNFTAPGRITGNSLFVNGLKVVGERATGWTASTGTALLGAFNANQTFTVSNPPTQSEVQAIATALTATRQRLKALEDMNRTHGLMN